VEKDKGEAGVNQGFGRGLGWRKGKWDGLGIEELRSKAGSELNRAQQAPRAAQDFRPCCATLIILSRYISIA